MAPNILLYLERKIHLVRSNCSQKDQHFRWRVKVRYRDNVVTYLFRIAAGLGIAGASLHVLLSVIVRETQINELRASSEKVEKESYNLVFWRSFIVDGSRWSCWPTRTKFNRITHLSYETGRIGIPEMAVGTDDACSDGFRVGVRIWTERLDQYQKKLDGTKGSGVPLLAKQFLVRVSRSKVQCIQCSRLVWTWNRCPRDRAGISVRILTLIE
jgi:hypothetical protein